METTDNWNVDNGPTDRRTAAKQYAFPSSKGRYGGGGGA